MTISAGTRLGRYDVRSQIGAGGMGEVYLAQDTQLRRPVALKFLPVEVGQNQDRLRRFEQEAYAVAALNHPNIAHIYEIGKAEGHHFIAMEYVEGKTLRKKIHQDHAPLPQLLKYLVQVAEGLTKAHGAGIVHRDLKPDNIMVTRDGYAKILDFGLAKLVERQRPPDRDSSHASTMLLEHQTEAGMIMGTIGYMSPEQAQGKSVDQRSDIFSCGCILYEAATRHLPFEGDSAIDTLHKIIHAPAPPIRDFNPLAPAELQRIARKCLAKDPDERYQSIKDVAIDLKELGRELEGGATWIPPGAEQGAETKVLAAARSTSSAEYLAGEIKQHKRSLAFGLAVLLGAVAGLSYWFYSTPSTDITNIESIAVMPFVNESGNSDVEYLSDGMTESLINGLSQLPKLSIKARSSVFRYKGKDVAPQTIASELSVQAILNGRVVQRGDDLALYLSLVDARNGNQLWGEQYNRKLSDLVALQSEIARDVSQKLRARLSGADEQKVTKNYTANTEAYRLYLRGRYHYLKTTQPEIYKGISFYQQAIDTDPTYALAYAGMADAYRTLPIAGWDMPPKEAFPQAKAAARRALDIDENLAEAHIVLGWVGFLFDWDWSAAESELKKAIELSPNNSDAHRAYAHLLSNLGQHREAIAEARRARELDPLSLITNALEGQFLFYAGRDTEAIERLKKTLELDPNFWAAHGILARVYIRQGRYDEAVAALTKAKELSGGSTEPITQLGYTLAKSGNRAKAQATLEELKLFSAANYVPAYSFAMIYNGLGEKNEALKYLEESFQEREVQITFIKIDTRWDELRAEPRFQDLLRGVGLIR